MAVPCRFLKCGLRYLSNCNISLVSVPQRIVKSTYPSHVKLIYPLQPTRHGSTFLTSLTAEQLWKGVTTVSNPGKKRGRGKGSGRKIAKDLNRGQILGVGKINMVWPGLNAPVIRGKEIVRQMELPPEKDREEKLIKLRDEMNTFRRLKLLPIERGWSGNKLPGRSIGPPDPIGDETFEGFDTKVLELRTVATMKANSGRTRRIRVLTVTGNKNGLAGFALGKAPEGKAALRKSKNRAAQRLQYCERFEDHTVFHDFHSIYCCSELFVKKKPKGYGLQCHRVIKTICEMIGITDLFVKVERSTNVLNMTKAFFLGLRHQKTHQYLADKMGLHLVELKGETDYFPKVVASPAKCRKADEIKPNEVIDFDELVSEGKVELVKPEPVPFYKKLPGWEVHLKKTERFRNHQKVHINLLAEYGRLTSFVHIREEQKQKEKNKAAVEEEET